MTGEPYGDLDERIRRMRHELKQARCSDDARAAACGHGIPFKGYDRHPRPQGIKGGRLGGEGESIEKQVRRPQAGEVCLCRYIVRKYETLRRNATFGSRAA